jgi:hypothetical protein
MHVAKAASQRQLSLFLQWINGLKQQQGAYVQALLVCNWSTVGQVTRAWHACPGFSRVFNNLAGLPVLRVPMDGASLSY